MRKLKGIGLLLIANVMIFITLSITFQILVHLVLPAFGIDLRGSIAQQDLLWAMVIGFGGAFISLAFSKQFARSMLNCTQITQPTTQAEQVIYGTVQD
ncbi:MAG: protease HtpX, partial [Nitrospirales bacterium]